MPRRNVKRSAQVIDLNPKLAEEDRIIPYTEETLQHIENLAAVFATYDDVAARFRCSKDSVERFFQRHPDAKQRWITGQSRGCVSLRANQFRLSKTNAAMAIFLGKNYLGQRDIVDQTPDRPSGLPPREELNRRIDGIREALARALDRGKPKDPK